MTWTDFRGSRALKKLDAQIEHAKREGAWSKVDQLLAQAGELLVKNKRPQEAIDLYAREGNYPAAAGIAEAHGMWGISAKLWLRAKDERRAANAYEKDGQHLAAAELLERAGDSAKSAEICEAEHDLVRAANLYEKIGQNVRAARLLVRAIKGQGRQRIVGQEAYELCRRAGALYAAAGDFGRAVAVLRAGGQNLFAAHLLAQAGRHDQALELYVQGGDLLSAAEVARTMGNDALAASLLGRRAMAEGRVLDAANYFSEAGKFLDAARLYEYAREPLRAAAAYEEAGLASAAAQIYQDAGRLEDAARCFKVSGDEGEARNALRQSRQLLRVDGMSAEHADPLTIAYTHLENARQGQAGEYERVIELLRAFPEDHPDYRRGQRLLASVHAERGQRQPAIAVLERLLGRRVPALSDLGALYQKAKLLEIDGQIAAATSTYETVATLDPGYLDVSQRLSALRGQVAAPEPGAPPTGDGAPPTTEPAEIRSTVEEAPALAASLASSSSVSGFPADHGYHEKAPPRPQRPALGTVLRGRFRIEACLGEGSQAAVYLARDVVLDRLIAIKFFNHDGRVTEAQLNGFLGEARLAAKVRHPVCLTVFDFGEEDGMIFVAMEYFAGATIKQRLERGPMAVDDALRVAKEISHALAAVHKAGILHRDVKPSNIMIDDEGEVRLADFGVAARVGEASSAPGTLVGTLKYMAPEQGAGASMDHRVDIYALGVVLHEMLSGKCPFEATLQSLIHRMSAPPPPLPAGVATSDELRSIVRRCLEPDPSARYTTVLDLTSALERELTMRSASATA
ncbi:MAG: protein kinase [Deltaproteobacteria bacterium]|nr:protein kinase [Deltaproteobacteria bacterium]